MEELHPSLNPGLDPNTVTLASGKEVTWLCMGCSCGAPHVWTARVKKRALYGHKCPVCAGSQPCRCSSLAVLRPEVAAQWHPSLNGSLQPTAVSVSSNAKVHWQCMQHDPPHAWPAVVSSRTRPGQGAGCPKCSMKDRVTNRHARGTVAEECPQLVEQWHPTLNGSETPHTVTCGSHKKGHWLCPTSSCQHPHWWQARVDERRTLHRDCPFCSGARVCACNSLAARYPAIAAEWHPQLNNESRYRSAAECRVQSNMSFWWQHESAGGAHEWYARVSNRTALGAGCPICVGRRWAAP